MRRSFLAAAIVPALAFAVTTLGSTKEAAAGPALGVDLDLGTAFGNQVGFSYGLGGRFGYKFVVPGTYLFLQPELGGHYMLFGNAQSGGFAGHAGKLFTGARLGYNGFVQPAVFGHIGIGWLGGAGVPSVTDGVAADVGFALDFRVTPEFTLGGHLAYNTVTIPSLNGNAEKWLSFGFQGQFDFIPHRERVVYVRRRY